MAEAGFSVAWVPAANLHLTSKFLGTVERGADRGHGRRLPARGGAPSADRAPGASGWAHFPRREKPSVLWVGVEAATALAALQRDVEAAMVGARLRRRRRAYHPHVTVGRVKGPARGAAGDESWKGDALFGASALGRDHRL